MSGFPTLQPALTARIVIDAPLPLGTLSRGGSLNIVPLTSGTLVSEPGFEPVVDAELVHGSDYIHADPSNERIRLDVRSVWKNKAGGNISFKYWGYINVTPTIGAILQGNSETVTTDWGHSYTHADFETGEESLKGLEAGVFVGAGRFVVTKGSPPVVEYKICRVGK